MATSGKKRKREIQDENRDFTDNFQYLRYLNEQKRRKVDSVRDGYCFKEQNLNLVKIDFEQKKKCVTPKNQQLKTLPPKSSRSRRRASLPATPSHALTLPPDPEMTPSSTSGSSIGDKSKNEELPPSGFSRSRTMRRSISGFARKSLRNLKGTLKDKVTGKMRQSLMEGKQDYSLPQVTAELDFFNFLDAQSCKTSRQKQQKKKDDEKDAYLQQKIDYEIKMRDGTAKLLAASKHPAQMLEAAKNLLTSNTRMIAYMSELQKRKTDEVLRKRRIEEGSQVPCKAKVSVSDVRIPLMWKDTDHFKNKGDHRRYAAFCLWKIGTEIYDTILLKDVDRSMTDLTFEDTVVFNDIGPEFECELEVYCHKLYDDLTIASTPRRIKKKINEISTSVGRSVGKRLSGFKDDTEFMANMLVGPKFERIAHATLRLSDVGDGVQTYDLTTEHSPASMDANNVHLPLFGHYCCRLAAQPYCLTQEAAKGMLSVKPSEGGEWAEYWCEVKSLAMRCWTSEDQKEVLPPSLTIPITKDTQVSNADPESSERPHSFHITIASSQQQYVLSATSEDDLKTWWLALQQHMLDIALWQHACEAVMDIKQPSPQKLPAFMRKASHTLSLYDETPWKEAEDSPMSKILARLCVDEEESTPPSHPQPAKVDRAIPTHSRIETDV